MSPTSARRHTNSEEGKPHREESRSTTKPRARPLRSPHAHDAPHVAPFVSVERLDRLKDAVMLGVAIVGVICLLSMETMGANAKMASAEPFNGNLAAVVTMVVSAAGSRAGWLHGKAVPATRKAHGLPSVDPVRLVQHDVFNLIALPILMALNFGVWLGLVDAYVYTVLFSCYMAADAVYIWRYPEAVPQPSLVLAHHSFVLALLSHPLRIPANAMFTANVAVVEVNTIILVGRRHFASWLSQDTTCRKAFRAFNEVVYWTTYFGIRFGIHPWMVLVAWKTVPDPFFERILIVGLLIGLVGFNTVLLVKQMRGAWDQPAAPTDSGR